MRQDDRTFTGTFNRSMCNVLYHYISSNINVIYYVYISLQNLRNRIIRLCTKEIKKKF